MLWEGNGSKREQMRRDIQRKISQINMERRELELPHNPYDKEQREFLSIEQGGTVRRSRRPWRRSGRAR